MRFFITSMQRRVLSQAHFRSPGAHVLCIVPINTIQNWLAEFNHWLPERGRGSSLSDSGTVTPRSFDVFLLNDALKNLEQRSRVIDSWRAEGGVLLMGYELYRLLANKRQRKKKASKKKASVRFAEDTHISLISMCTVCYFSAIPNA